MKTTVVMTQIVESVDWLHSDNGGIDVLLAAYAALLEKSKKHGRLQPLFRLTIEYSDIIHHHSQEAV